MASGRLKSLDAERLAAEERKLALAISRVQEQAQVISEAVRLGASVRMLKGFRKTARQSLTC
jgi:hypothetical protein